MKTLLIAFIIPAIAVGQTSYEDFKVEDQEIIYQKVFTQDSVTTEKLAKFYEGQPYISNLAVSGGTVTFKVNDIMVDYAKFQFHQVGTPTIIQTGKYSGEASVGVRDGRYRVTVRSIRLTGDIDYKKITDPEDLSGYATIKSATALNKDWCRPNMLGLLSKGFTDQLQFVDKEGGDW